jgi:hypothetical protein
MISLQSEEEIQRFTLQEDLTECQRIKALLAKKNNTQQSYVFLNAINVFKGDSEMQSQLIPLIIVTLSSVIAE